MAPIWNPREARFAIAYARRWPRAVAQIGGPGRGRRRGSSGRISDSIAVSRAFPRGVEVEDAVRSGRSSGSTRTRPGSGDAHAVRATRRGHVAGPRLTAEMSRTRPPTSSTRASPTPRDHPRVRTGQPGSRSSTAPPPRRHDPSTPPSFQRGRQRREPVQHLCVTRLTLRLTAASATGSLLEVLRIRRLTLVSQSRHTGGEACFGEIDGTPDPVQHRPQPVQIVDWTRSNDRPDKHWLCLQPLGHDHRSITHSPPQSTGSSVVPLPTDLLADCGARGPRVRDENRIERVFVA